MFCSKLFSVKVQTYVKKNNMFYKKLKDLNLLNLVSIRDRTLKIKRQTSQGLVRFMHTIQFVNTQK